MCPYLLTRCYTVVALSISGGFSLEAGKSLQRAYKAFCAVLQFGWDAKET